MAMGYEPEDLPWEVPLIELGLDSMMAVRIKNRVEYDFDLPPIQLQAVRDANLYNVEKIIEYAIEHRDEVQDLHEHQKTQTAEEIAKEQAALLSGATPASVDRTGAGSRPSRSICRAIPCRRTDPAAALTRPVRPGGCRGRAAQPGRRRPGAQPAGRRRCAEFRCAAA